MSFTSTFKGRTFNAGYFLANDEKATKETREIKQTGATADGAVKYVKSGTVYPANDATAIGFVYEDTDVTNGNMPGSVVTSGIVYEDRLPAAVAAAAKTALQEKGFVFIAKAPAIGN